MTDVEIQSRSQTQKSHKSSVLTVGGICSTELKQPFSERQLQSLMGVVVETLIFTICE